MTGTSSWHKQRLFTTTPLHASTRHSPVYANYGFHTLLHFAVPTDSQVPAAADLAAHLHQVHQELTKHLEATKKAYKHHANPKSHVLSTLSVGDKVWLSSKHLRSSCPLAKLYHQYLGLFNTTEQKNPVAFRLQLPESLEVHLVFHMFLMKPYAENPFPGHSASSPLPTDVQGQEEYKVWEILHFKEV